MSRHIENCNTCRYINYEKNEYPCTSCENRYISLYEPLPDLNINDLVIIGECAHNNYIGQIGIVMKVNKKPCNNLNENYYYVLAYDKKQLRYWECGFNRSELIPTSGNLQDLLKAYDKWKK